MNKALVLQNENKMQESLAFYEKALKINDQLLQIYYNRIPFFLRLKRYEEAWKDIQSLQKIDGTYKEKEVSKWEITTKKFLKAKN
jgi:tetratricopeptide (TPR) repeat protein